MDYSRIEYIKNVNNVNEPYEWAYNEYSFEDEFKLNFSRRTQGVENHAENLPMGSVIILSQRPRGQSRFLTHVVELVTEGREDKPEWTPDRWGVFRSARVLWVIPDFDNPAPTLVDQVVLKAKWVYQNSQAKQLKNSTNLMLHWGNIENLREHLKSHEVFGYSD